MPCLTASVRTMMLEISCLKLTGGAAQHCKLAACCLSGQLLRGVGGITKTAYFSRQVLALGTLGRAWLDQAQPMTAHKSSCTGLATFHAHDQGLPAQISLRSAPTSTGLPSAADRAQPCFPGISAGVLVAQVEQKGSGSWPPTQDSSLFCSLHSLTCTRALTSSLESRPESFRSQGCRAQPSSAPD